MSKHTGREGNKREIPELEMESTVAKLIEKKPHATYIKYLLTKRCGVQYIISELRKLGLSSPRRNVLIEYFNEQVYPLIKKNKLTSIYGSYKLKINGQTNKKPGGKTDFVSQILNFKSEIGEASVTTQANFCKFLKDLGVEAPWMWELVRFYGTAENFPTDSNGVRILALNYSKAALDKIVTHKYRYIIERLIIENLSDQRISDYCKTSLGANISRLDISLYKEVFFNTKLNGIDENIKLLEGEKKSQEVILQDIRKNTEEYRNMSPGDLSTLVRQINQRISEIDENLRALKAVHSDLSYDTRIADLGNYQEMFADIVKRSYRKFCKYDMSNDRDIATPMSKIANIMGAAYDKLEKISEVQVKSSSEDDGGIKYGIASLMQDRLDEIEDQEKARANAALREAGLPELDDNINMDEIGGVEELGMDFSEEEGDLE